MKKRATIIDGSTRIHVEGFIKREYDNGAITIEDSRGIIYFATSNRIISKENDDGSTAKPESIQQDIQQGDEDED